MSTARQNVDKVENFNAKCIGCKFAVALSSGTEALHLAMKLAGVRHDEKIFCSDMTFSATVNPVVYEGGVPVFIDSEYEAWNMALKTLENAFELYPQVKVVVVANLYGTPAKLNEIIGICRRYNAILIEDAAESLGATYRGRPTGSFCTYNAISYMVHAQMTDCKSCA